MIYRFLVPVVLFLFMNQNIFSQEKDLPPPKTVSQVDLKKYIGARGNQYVDIKVLTPKDLDSKAKDVIKEVGALYKEDPRKGLLRR